MLSSYASVALLFPLLFLLYKEIVTIRSCNVVSLHKYASSFDGTLISTLPGGRGWVVGGGVLVVVVVVLEGGVFKKKL